MFTLSARATRRKRLAVTSALGVLSLLVVAAAVGLYLIRDAQQEATAQAHRVAEQLALTRNAEQAARAEHGKAVAANQKLESQNADLVAAARAADQARIEADRARVEADLARLRAEQSRRLEQRSKRRAIEAARRAEQAKAEATEASADLQRALDIENQRIHELQEATKGVAKLITHVDTD